MKRKILIKLVAPVARTVPCRCGVQQRTTTTTPRRARSDTTEAPPTRRRRRSWPAPRPARRRCAPASPTCSPSTSTWPRSPPAPPCAATPPASRPTPPPSTARRTATPPTSSPPSGSAYGAEVGQGVRRSVAQQGPHPRRSSPTPRPSAEGRQGRQGRGRRRPHAYAKTFGTTLNSVNENLPADVVEEAITSTPRRCIAVIDAQKAGDQPTVYPSLRDGLPPHGRDRHGARRRHRRPSSRTSSTATPTSPAAALRAGLDSLLREHVWLAASATGAALGGRMPQFEAAAAALNGPTNSNTADIVAAIAQRLRRRGRQGVRRSVAQRRATSRRSSPTPRPSAADDKAGKRQGRRRPHGLRQDVRHDDELGEREPAGRRRRGGDHDARHHAHGRHRRPEGRRPDQDRHASCGRPCTTCPARPTCSPRRRSRSSPRSSDPLRFPPAGSGGQDRRPRRRAPVLLLSRL